MDGWDNGWIIRVTARWYDSSDKLFELKVNLDANRLRRGRHTSDSRVRRSRFRQERELSSDR